MAEPTPRDTLLDHAYEIADKNGQEEITERGNATNKTESERNNKNQ